MKFIFITILFLFITLYAANAQSKDENPSAPLVTTKNGILEGIEDSGVYIFKGIPYAQPPVGDLRWKPPQPVKNWAGTRKADQFGPGAMQNPIFSDMQFRFPKKSEDCLYLNVWTPVNNGNKKLPVLVYIYGGGFQAGHLHLALFRHILVRVVYPDHPKTVPVRAGHAERRVAMKLSRSS